MTDPLTSPLASLEERAKALGVSDRLSLRDYVTRAEIGAFQSERGVAQRLRFNVVVELHEPTAGVADDVDKIMSYDRIAEAIEEVLAQDRLDLLETLADQVAARILREDQALRVFLRVEKLDRGPGELGVEILREGAGAEADNRLPAAEILLATINQEIPDRRPMIICPDFVPVDVSDVASQEARRRILLLAAEQTAWKIAAVQGLDVVASRTELDWAIRQGKRVVWAPGKLVLDAASAPDEISGRDLETWLRTRIKDVSE